MNKKNNDSVVKKIKVKITELKKNAGIMGNFSDK